MRKFKLVVIVLALVVVSLSFVACKTDYKKFAGNYYLSSITESGETLTIDELLENGQVQDKNNEVIVLSSEETFVSHGLVGERSGKLVISSQSITIMGESESFVGSIENGKITINVDGATYVFVKA